MVNRKALLDKYLYMVLIVAGFGFLISTSPNELPIFALFVPFLWLFLLLFWLFRAAIGFFFAIEGIRLKFSAGLFAGMPVFLLVLQSIGQLSGRDILLSIVFLLFGLLYMQRADFVR